MDDAIRLLGSFVNFVRQENPELASKLMVTALKWAVREQLPMHKLAAVLKEPRPGDSA